MSCNLEEKRKMTSLGLEPMTFHTKPSCSTEWAIWNDEKIMGNDVKMQILHLLLAAPNSCKFRGKFAFVHHFPHLFSSFQIAHSVEREGLVWKVMGSSPSEVIVLFSSRLQLIGANMHLIVSESTVCVVTTFAA